MSRTHISPLIKAQLEKLTSSGIDISSGHRSMYSSSPVIIPKKPPRSNTSSQSSSSYPSIADQMSSSGETSLQLRRDSDDVSSSVLPTLTSTCDKLEHSAARDRIAVKCRRQKSIKSKLTSLKETDDNQVDIFSSKHDNDDDDENIFSLQTQSKPQSQSAINLSELKRAQASFLTSVRARDHSADNIITSTHVSSIQRSVSFKHSQDANQETFFNRPLATIKKQQEEEENKHESILEDAQLNNISSIKHIISPPPEEHIYDNSSIFSHHQINLTPNRVLNDEDTSINNIVKIRGPRTSTTNRLRPVTMYTPTNNDKQINEFENVFNQIKNHAAIKKIQQNEEIVSTKIEKVTSRPTSMLIEGTPSTFSDENEPSVPTVTTVNKKSEASIVLQMSNQRKTSSNANLSTNNKIFTNDHQTGPSWIDIAKQKQSKFQPELIEKPVQEEPQHQPISITIPNKQVSKSSKILKEDILDTTEPQKKSIVNPTIVRRPSPHVKLPHTNAFERDSIRALKASNPNRINNLIQLFDK